MSLKGIVPSAHYPDYLRQDLRIGEADVHPLAAALDEVFSKWFLLAQKSAHGLVPGAWSEENCEAALEYHGFETSQLPPSTRRELFRLLPRLFALKGQLSGIEALACLYFGHVRVQRGRTEEAAPSKNGIRLPLRAVEVGSRDRVLLVRVQAATDEAKVAEFTANAKRLMPDYFELIVATEPSLPSNERKDIQIGAGTRLERRRL